MDNNSVPITVLMAMASMSGDSEQFTKVVCEAYRELTQKLLKVVHEYPTADLPFIVATMLITANTVRGMLTDSGKNIVEQFLRNTTTVVVDKEELARQAGLEADGGGEEKR